MWYIYKDHDMALSLENEKELDNDLTYTTGKKCALVTLGIWVILQTEQSGPD